MTESLLNRLNESSLDLTVFIAVDGAKNKSDAENINKIKLIVNDKKYRNLIKAVHFSKKHMGIQQGVSTGIDWFFEQVNEGVILEDDLEFFDSFLEYSANLLKKYRSDQKVMMISGNNFFPKLPIHSSYTFTKHALIWGWATWKDRWSMFHQVISDKKLILEDEELQQNLIQIASSLRIKRSLESLQGNIDSWAYIWGLAMYLNQGLCVIPQENLVKNIGFGTKSTHTKIKTYHAYLQVSQKFSVVTHPLYPLANQSFDRLFIKYDNPILMMVRTFITKFL